jgi:hypothetical protein
MSMVARKTKPGSRPKRTPARKRAGGSSAPVTPLAYLLQVMRDPAAPAEMRFEAAKAAAPLVHPQLAVTTYQTK